MACSICKQEKTHHAKGMCYKCYKNTRWTPKIAKKSTCERCKREKIIHTRGICRACYNYIFRLDNVKELNSLKSFNLTLEEYKNLAKSCIICGFDKIVELHHLDENKTNNSKENLVPLCPNHHKMIHNYEFRQEIREILQEKGFFLKKDSKLDFFINQKKNKK